MNEVDRVRDVYATYDRTGRSARWAGDRAVLAERAALLAETLRGRPSATQVGDLRVLDLGCGRGELRSELVAAGITAENIVGVDLLPDRLQQALCAGLAVCESSGAALPFQAGSFDLVVMYTVLSSVADEDVVGQIMAEVDRVLAPGGALIVYDMRLPSPGNPQVRPVTSGRLARWCPGWAVSSRSCTVIPPLARRVAARPGAVYSALSLLPALRSHRLTVLTPPPRRSTSGIANGSVQHSAGGDPNVSVVMPIRNEGSFIERSLGAVLNQIGATPAQVVVVDGHSDDDTAERVRALAADSEVPVVLIDNPRRIVPISMNLGLEQAIGEIVVRVDGHCVIAPDYIRRCIDALRSTDAECVGGPMETIGETTVARAIAVAQSSRFGVGGVAFRTSAEAGFVDTLAFGAYRREVLDRIGWFDESFVRNQDDELNLRLTRSGGRIWMDPSIRSTYFSRGTIGGLWRQYHGYGFYKVRVMRKHRTVPSVRHLVPAAFVAGLSVAAAASLVRRSPWPAAAVVGPYGLALAASSVQAARSATPRSSPLTVAIATATMHVAYGAGWWAGALREVRRRTADPADQSSGRITSGR